MILKALGTTGVITGVDYDFDFEVTYPSGNKWTFNPAVLTRVSDSNSNSNELNDENEQPTVKNAIVESNNLNEQLNNSKISQASNSELKLNDLVEINSDIEYIKLVQKGHGEWADAMQPVINFLYLIS